MSNVHLIVNMSKNKTLILNFHCSPDFSDISFLNKTTHPSNCSDQIIHLMGLSLMTFFHIPYQIHQQVLNALASYCVHSLSDLVSSHPLFLWVLDYGKTLEFISLLLYQTLIIYTYQSIQSDPLKPQVRSCFFIASTFLWLLFSFKIKSQTLTWSIKSFWS